MADGDYSTLTPDGQDYYPVGDYSTLTPDAGTGSGYPYGAFDGAVGEADATTDYGPGSGAEDPYSAFYGAEGQADASTGYSSGGAAQDPYSAFYGAESNIDARIEDIDRELESPYPSGGGGATADKIASSALDAAGKVAQSVADAVAKNQDSQRRTDLERERLELERERLKLSYQGRETPYGIGYRWGSGGKRPGESYSPATQAEAEQFTAGQEAGLKTRVRQAEPQNTGIVPPHLGGTPPIQNVGDAGQMPGWYYTIARGDSLERLALRYLGDSRRWVEIQRANPQITDKDKIYIGQRIRIPGDEPANSPGAGGAGAGQSAADKVREALRRKGVTEI